MLTEPNYLKGQINDLNANNCFSTSQRFYKKLLMAIHGGTFLSFELTTVLLLNLISIPIFYNSFFIP